MNKKIFLGLALLATLSFTSCNSKSEPENVKLEATQKAVLNDVSYKIIIPTYETLVQKTTVLYDKVVELQRNKTTENLNAARQAWRDARRPWEQSESFLFGPTGDQGLDPALDSWPVDVEAMNSVLSGSAAITAASLEVNNDARGFHLIEFLLWGEDGNKNVSALTTRQLEYLVAAAQDVKNNADKLVKYWTPYAKTLAAAGADNHTYPSPEAAFQQLVMGMIDISNEVGNEKIENPLNGQEEGDNHKDNRPHPDLEESRFSHNSKADYTDNIQSIANVYEGKLNGQSYKGLAVVIAEIAKAEKNSELEKLNKDIINQIAVAQQSIQAIPGTFTDAIKESNANGRAAVKKAQAEVGKLNDLLLKLNEKAFHAAAPQN